MSENTKKTSGAIITYAETIENITKGLAGLYEDPWHHYMEPFRMFGNLWYVGDKQVCSHLIDTGDGLILFDTGYGATAAPMLIKSIEEAGFSVKDIRYIIHSHGHFDHFGCGNLLRELSGATVCMSAVDTRLLRENPDRALCHLSPGVEICWPDRELHDGDHIVLGNTDITCLLTPGHTCGTMTFFFDVTDGEKKLRAGYLGGAGFLSIYKEYNQKYGLPLDKNQQFMRSLHKLRNYEVDIHLGNHPNHNRTLQKRQLMLEDPGSNPFVDREAWPRFLARMEELSLEFEELGY